MLVGLDDVLWSTLEHAYGPADDVPEILRDVARGDTEAVGALYGNIWHQGTVYPATSKAVPFLVDLLAGPEEVVVPLVHLLACIARGTGYLAVHQSLSPPSERPSTAELDDEAAWVRAARAAVVDGLPAYVNMLDNGAPEVRAAVAHLLCALDTADAARDAALLAAIADDDDVGVRGSAIVGLGARAPLDALLRWLEDDAPVVRVCAATVAAQNDGASLPRVLEVLMADAPDAMDDLESVPAVAEDGDVLRYVASALSPRWELQCALVERWLGHAHAQARRGAAFVARMLVHGWRHAAERILSALMIGLGDVDESVRMWCAWTLRDAGSVAAPAADALWATLQKHKPVRATAAGFALKALCALHDARAASYLAAQLALAAERKNFDDIETSALAQLGPWAPQCFELLAALIPVAPLGNERIAVIDAVASYGARAEVAFAAIRAQLEAQPHIVTRVLGDLGPAAAPALLALRARARDDDAQIRWNVARAIFRISGDAEPALAEIAQSLASAGRTKLGGLELLAEIGAAGVQFATVLPPLFDDDDDWIAVRAAVAHWAVVGDADAVVAALCAHVKPVPSGFIALTCVRQIGAPARACADALRAWVQSEARVVQYAIDDEVVSEDTRWVALCQEALAHIG